MPFHFNYMKTIQAVAFLLRQAGPARMDNYMRLLKLLYIADRRSLEKIGRPITGDQVVAMEHGPVLSHVLDLIKDRTFGSPEWARFFEREGCNIRLIDDPGNGELCQYEIDLLQSVWDEHRLMGEWAVVRETHEFPEWKKNDPGTSVKAIPLRDILEAVGREQDIEEVEQKARRSSAFRAFFGG